MRLLAVAAALVGGLSVISAQGSPDLSAIHTIVVIYAENRGFDSLYGHFPGADGLDAGRRAAPQQDRDGTPLKELPPIWAGLTAPGVTPAITQAETAHLPNAPFGIDDPAGF